MKSHPQTPLPVVNPLQASEDPRQVVWTIIKNSLITIGVGVAALYFFGF